jgi:hypothetical protein
MLSFPGGSTLRGMGRRTTIIMASRKSPIKGEPAKRDWYAR